MTDAQSAIVPAAGRPLTAIQGLTARFRGVLQQPAVKRAFPLVGVAITVGIGLLFLILLREPGYTVVYPNLADDEKPAVLEALESGGVAARLNEATGQVEVPESEYHRARMLLAANNLPRAAASGYDLLTDMPIGTSRSVEQAKLKQTQETELARSIMEIQDVVAARVHLALPERSVFVRDRQPPSASVFIRVNPGRQLGQSQIQSIVHLVSSSVPFMSVDQVTVVDQYGTLLSDPQRQGDMGLTAQQLEHRMRVEKLLRDRVLNLLTPIAGFGNVSAEVNVDMNFARKESTRESFDPEGAALRSEQSTLDENREPPARGIPGALSNQPPPAAEIALEPETEAEPEVPVSRSSNTVRNFEVSREVETTRETVGQISRISVAVLVREQTVTNEDGQAVSEELPAEERERMIQLIREAIGYDAARGDSVSIMSSPFVEVISMVEPHWFQAPWIDDLIKQIGAIVILALLVLGALRPLFGRFMARMMGTPMPGADDRLLPGPGDAITVREGESLEDIKARLKPKRATISAELLDTANTYDDKVAIIRMLVAEDSGRVSNVLKTLIRRDLN